MSIVTPERLDRPFYERDASVVAPALIGCRLVTNIDGRVTVGVILETEAYLSKGDEASHSFRGKTRRNSSMFLAGGHAYVYFIYGVHHCFNVVTGEEGTGEAVLIRAVRIVDGEAFAGRRRELHGGGLKTGGQLLTDGPAKLVVAMGITREHDGLDLTTTQSVWLEPPAEGEPNEIVEVTGRIGIRRSQELALRWKSVSFGARRGRAEHK